MQNEKALREWCGAAVELVRPSEAKDAPPFAPAYNAYEKWCEMNEGAPPSRQDLDPMFLGAGLLPYLSIIEVIDEGSDYMWALVGERIPSIVGTRLTGKRLSQIEDMIGEPLRFRELLDKVANETRPVFYTLRHRTTDGRLKRSYGALLPLRDLPHRDPSHVVVAAILSASDATTGV